MSQTIIDLWKGDIAPIDRCGAFDTEATRLSLQMDRMQTKSRRSFDRSAKNVFLDFVEKTDCFYLRMMELAFQEGFSLGSKLTSEALS